MYSVDDMESENTKACDMHSCLKAFPLILKSFSQLAQDAIGTSLTQAHAWKVHPQNAAIGCIGFD